MPGVAPVEVRRRRLRALEVAAIWYGVPGSLVYGMFFGNSGHPIGMILFPATLGGMIGLIVACHCGFRSKAPLSWVDLFRIACWTLVGSALGATQFGGYYVHFYPRAGWIVMACARAGLALALVSIVISVFAFPRPTCSDGKCTQCGYDLRGLPESRCPECGQSFGPPGSREDSAKDQ